MNINPRYQPPQEGFISNGLFHWLLARGKIVDGRAGGLVFGRKFEDGGILAVFRLGTGYVIRGQTEGGEFAINWKASTENLNRLKMMNSGLTLREVVPQNRTEPQDVSQLIITGAHPHDRLIFFHWAQIIVTREATAKHIVELDEMNRAPNPYLECDLWKVFGCAPGTEDEVV